MWTMVNLIISPSHHLNAHKHDHIKKDIRLIFLNHLFQLVKSLKGNTTTLSTGKPTMTEVSITTAKSASSDDDDDDDIDDADTNMVKHDYSECCASLNVTAKCMGFCAIHNIIDGTTGIEPEMCEKDFPRIVQCMADGRNHLPCCERQKIPDLCQDMCQGEYTAFTDFVRSRVSCVAYTMPALKCILEGVQNIPSPPRDVIVEPLTEKSLQVSWSPPARLAHRVRSYSINVTMLHSFDQDSLANISSEVHASVAGTSDSAVIGGLKPFTMYSITMTANNENGTSLPSERIRTLTLDSGIGARSSVAVVPVLPGIFLLRKVIHLRVFSVQSQTDWIASPRGMHGGF